MAEATEAVATTNSNHNNNNHSSLKEADSLARDKDRVIFNREDFLGEDRFRSKEIMREAEIRRALQITEEKEDTEQKKLKRLEILIINNFLIILISN